MKICMMGSALVDRLVKRICNGKRRMSQFIEDLLRPHVLDSCLDDGYRAMAEDTARESEAHEWCNALAKDIQ
jgi:hypothetical protein